METFELITLFGGICIGAGLVLAILGICVYFLSGDVDEH